MMLPITSTIAAILAIIMFPLSQQVSLRRISSGKATDHQREERLKGSIRAFGNFTEYVPICLILFGLMELQGASSTLLWWIGGLFVLGRTIHAISMTTQPRFSLYRVFAMLMTYPAFLIPAGWLLIHHWT